MESKAANGEPIDINAFCTLASTTVRLSQRLGIERRAREIVPSVADYVAHIEKAGAA